jgi:hypothetical protein
MVKINLLVTVLAALVPIIIGSIWYNPKVFGKAWIKATGLTEEELRKTNMVKVFGLSLLFSLMLSSAMNMIVIHQFHFLSALMNEPGLNDAGTEVNAYVMDFFNKYGHNFRTFKHGMLHGTIAGIFMAMPIIGILALFERKSGKYIMIHTGYWIICMMLMGGIICQFT